MEPLAATFLLTKTPISCDEYQHVYAAVKTKRLQRVNTALSTALMRDCKTRQVRRNVSSRHAFKSFPVTLTLYGELKKSRLTVETLAKKTSAFVLLETIGAVIH